MKLSTPIKTAGIAIAAIALTAGTAYAGNGKDCKNKTHAAKAPAAATSTMTSTTTEAPYSAVLPASSEAAPKAHKKKMKVLTFDQALELCQKKGVSDLQGCIDKKTGQTAKPES